MVFARVLAAATLAAGCRGSSGSRDPVAAAIADGVRAQLGVAARTVTCTRERCDIVLASGLTLEARVSGDREVIWESEEVVRTAPISAYVRAELAALGVDAQVDCGPPLVLASAATRITCTLAGRPPASATAWVDVLSDGGLALEMALDDETVHARTEEVDPAGLDELSRALDTDEAEGVTGGENDPDPTDAGPTADAGVDATR